VIYVVSFSSLALALLEEVRTPKREKSPFLELVFECFQLNILFSTPLVCGKQRCVCFFNSFLVVLWKKMGIFVLILGVFGFFLMWWRCFYGWEMVLHSVFGGWQINNKVGFIEEEISRGMPFLLFSIWDFLLHCRIAASKTTWCFPLEASLSWQKRAFTWYWYFPGFFFYSAFLYLILLVQCFDCVVFFSYM